MKLMLMRLVVSGLPALCGTIGFGPAFAADSDAHFSVLSVGDGTRAVDFSSLSARDCILSVAGLDLPLDATPDADAAPAVVSDVPEPHIFSLLLSGVCALAFVVVRRKR